MIHTKFNNKPNKVHQLENGHVWQSRSCVVVGHVHCVINDEIYILLGKRGTGKNKGKYNVPCGYLDWSENIENGMYRELWEEAGLYIPDYQDKIIYKATNIPWDINSDPSVGLQNIIFHCGVVLKLDTLPTLSLDNMEPNECESAEWIHINEAICIPNEKICFGHEKRITEFYLKYYHLIPTI